MEVYSTNSTVFAYSNYFMEQILGDQKCKDGVVYKQFGAIELMPMGYPNAINQVIYTVICCYSVAHYKSTLNIWHTNI